MSKRAEEAALKAYPDPEFDGYYDDRYVSKKSVAISDRFKFIKGYEQAGQDLALTAEDVSCIIHLADQFGKDYQKIANVFNKDREEEDETQ